MISQGCVGANWVNSFGFVAVEMRKAPSMGSAENFVGH